MVGDMLVTLMPGRVTFLVCAPWRSPKKALAKQRKDMKKTTAAKRAAMQPSVPLQSALAPRPTSAERLAAGMAW